VKTLRGTLLLVLASAALAFAQDRVGTIVGAGIGLNDNASQEPFSADSVTTIDRVLPDGTRIHQELHGKTYRDSQGRTRMEMELASLGGGPPRLSISIHDPVQKIFIYLEPEAQRARIHHEPNAPPAEATPNDGPPATQTTRPAAPSINHEDLGTTTIDGWTAKGRRTTRTIEAGQIGNDRPIVSTNEIWSSPELHVPLLRKSDDPQRGQVTVKLINIRRGEPDPALFQIPDGYKVASDKPETH